MIEADEIVEDYGPPPTWGPEWVLHRLVEANVISLRLPLAVKPMTHKTLWPEIMRSYADLRDAQAFADARAEFWQGRRQRASADEMSRFQEAVHWPLSYLPDQDITCDALRLTAYWEARTNSKRAFWRKVDAVLERQKGQPGRVWDRATLTSECYRGCYVIAIGLRRDGVPVR
jgi:hypothetical protein